MKKRIMMMAMAAILAAMFAGCAGAEIPAGIAAE